MSIPAEEVQAAIDSSANADANSSLTFEQRVNQAVDSASKDEQGNIILPDDLSEDIEFAARSEKRRRDTQSALAKVSNTKSVLEVENEELKKLVVQGARIVLSPEEQEEMKELKFSDPDAWREKMNALEQNAVAVASTQVSEISESAKTTGTVGERQVLLEAFQHDNPGLVINDDVLANDIPPRITRALETGDISFIGFLGKVKEYLESGKVIENTKPSETPNLSDVGGSDTPGESAESVELEQDYEKMIF